MKRRILDSGSGNSPNGLPTNATVVVTEHVAPSPQTNFTGTVSPATAKLTLSTHTALAPSLVYALSNSSYFQESRTPLATGIVMFAQLDIFPDTLATSTSFVENVHLA